MTRRITLLAALLVALVVGGLVLRRALESDEARIARHLREMAEDFDDRDRSGILERIAGDFRDETRRIDRPTLDRGLAFVFSSWGYYRDGRFQLAARVPEEEMEVSVDGDSARATITVALDRFEGEEPVEAWRGRFELEFVRIDGDWLLRRSRHEGLSGEWPF